MCLSVQNRGDDLKIFEKHKKKVAKAKETIRKNKVFFIMLLIAIVFFLTNSHFRQGEPLPQYEFCEETGEYIIIVDNPEHVILDEAELVSWRFYWIDVVILVAGGGFCIVMILRNRQKTKREL